LDFQPDIVGITGYTVHVNVVKKLFEEIKHWNQNTLTVVGGHHATVLPEDFNTPNIDLIVIGDGVFAFQEIVKRYEREETFGEIPGVVVVKENRIGATEKRPTIELDDFPFPERSLTKKYRKDYYSEWMKPLASICTSKGCPFRCKFCTLWKLTGGQYLKREPERIVQELATIEEENVFFADDESMIDVPRMRRLADLIKEAGIKKNYFVYARSDTISKNPELFKVWEKIGLKRVFVGLEFVQDDDLSYIQKKSSSEDNDRAVQILHDLGVDVYASFIIRPEFTLEDFSLLRKYCRKLNLTFASFAVLTPLPGTELYEELKDQMVTQNYDYFDFIHTLLPTELPLKSFYREYYKLYQQGISPKQQLVFLRKYPLKELPHLLLKGQKFYRQLLAAYKDY
jgi:radical SAM superfamily enzyme YgiQ (UPF0313 family)